MRKLVPLVVASLIAACAGSPPEKADAIEDFIVVNELEEVAAIRTHDQPRSRFLTDKYVIMEVAHDYYLMEFRRRCRELSGRQVIPDTRRDAAMLRARYDTIRGCTIGRFYELDAGQVQELLHIRQLPGETS